MNLAGQLRPIVAALAVLGATACLARAEEANDYPTSARAEYVYGCMKANGESRQAIEQCSCSIDVVASIVSYERYVTAETALSMSQVRGNLGEARADIAARAKPEFVAVCETGREALADE